MNDASERRVEGLLREPASLARTHRLLLPRNAPVWPDARIAVATVPVAAATARAWLPRALRAADPARATIFVAEYPSTSFGIAYREAGVLLHARRFGREVVHCAWMVVDDDRALVLGRELLGFPKKLAQIEFALADGRVKARVLRRGTTLVALEGRAPQRTEPQPAFPLPIANVRPGPSFLPALLLRIKVPERPHATWTDRFSIRVEGTAFDPLDPLEIKAGDVDGRIVVSDLGAPPDQAGPLPRGIFPIGLVSPFWIARQLPFRSF